MSLLKINPFRASQDLQLKVQSIEAQIKLKQVTQSTKQKLFLELEGTCLAVESLQANALSISRLAKSKLKDVGEFTQLQAENEWDDLEILKKKIITLFGDIHSSYIDDEVEEIQKEADHLEASLQGGDAKKISIEIKSLAKHIKTFCDNHRPSRESRKIIALANHSLKKATNVLQQKVLGQTINQWNLLSIRKEGVYGRDVF